jgi:hypothetical protein
MLLEHLGLAWETFAVEMGFKQGDVISSMLFTLYMDCGIRDVMPTIKSYYYFYYNFYFFCNYYYYYYYFYCYVIIIIIIIITITIIVIIIIIVVVITSI